jgi:hypothetical protein
MRSARLAELTAALAITTSACSLLTSLDGLSSSPVSDIANGDARADGDGTGATEASTEAAADAPMTSEALDAFDAGDEAGPNLHPQGTFENGTTDPWAGYQGTIDIAATAHSGNGACRACTNPTTTDFFTADDNRTSGPGEVGATYRAEAWVRADPSSPAPPSVQLILRNATLVNGKFTALESSASPLIPIDATWRHLEITLTFTKAGDLNIFVGASTAPNACFLIDDVVLRRVK